LSVANCDTKEKSGLSAHLQTHHIQFNSSQTTPIWQFYGKSIGSQEQLAALLLEDLRFRFFCVEILIFKICLGHTATAATLYRVNYN